MLVLVLVMVLVMVLMLVWVLELTDGTYNDGSSCVFPCAPACTCWGLRQQSGCNAKAVIMGQNLAPRARPQFLMTQPALCGPAGAL
jgi:hypothetical protein